MFLRKLFILLAAVFIVMGAAPSPSAKFNLTVNHLEGLNPTEVVYTVTPNRGSIGGSFSYSLVHKCYEDGNINPTHVIIKGIWFSGHGSNDYGTAYFFTFNDICTGVVIDQKTGAEVSPTLSYDPSLITSGG